MVIATAHAMRELSGTGRLGAVRRGHSERHEGCASRTRKGLESVNLDARITLGGRFPKELNFILNLALDESKKRGSRRVWIA